MARIGLIGYGFIADLHARAVRATGATLAAVSGHDATRAAEFAARYGARSTGEDWEGLVRSDDIDAVVVATPNFLHHRQTVAALAAGKHVLVEKPMAVTVAEAEQMRDAAAEADRVLCVGHMWRYRDEVRAVRDRIASGSLGRVVRTRGYGVHAGWGPSGWFTDPALAGGGALIDMGIHALDTARFLLGDPLPRRVVASLGNGFGPPDHDRPPAVDTDGVVLVDWDNGVRSVVECGWWQPVLDGLEAETDVYATGGHARIWPDVTADRPPATDYDHCDLPMYAAQMADFLRCCADGGVPVASADVGVEAVRLVEAAVASAAEVRA